MLPKPRIVCGPIVRRTSSTSATLWVEVDNDCVLHARAAPILGPDAPSRRPVKKPPLAVSDGIFTVKVGGRFYALLTLDRLAPGWLYSYAIFYRVNEGRRNPALWFRDPNAGGWWEFEEELAPLAIGGKRPTFRTFPQAKTEDIRMAFGSCRKLGRGRGADVLPLFGRHLEATAKERLTTWPHLLLLLGDQIYADNVDPAVIQKRLRAPGRGAKALGCLDAPESILKWERDRTPPGAKKTLVNVFGHSIDIRDLPDLAGANGFHCLEYADFAELYVAAWADREVRRVLANLPTFMTFDDHDVSNAWNLSRGWVEQMKKSPAWVKAVTEGLAAYWLYQGWGNPHPPGGKDARAGILESAALDGTDALDKLQKWFAAHLDKQVPYYYEIDVTPPVLVLDTRNDRTFVPPTPLGPHGVVPHADPGDEILSEAQWKWLRSRIDQQGPVVLASGVPFLQLLCIDIFLLMGVRGRLGRGIEEQSQDLADVFEFFRREIDTDQWTSFPKSFDRLARELLDKGPFIFLSGDVHYSYGMLGRTTFPAACKMGKNPMILHAVSSPLFNQWSEADLKTNNPERCPSAVEGVTGETYVRNARTGIENRVREGHARPCDPDFEPDRFMRLFLPEAMPIFSQGKQQKKWTHENSIGMLEVWQDGKSAQVTWLGASNRRGQALRELGSIGTVPGTFVR